MESEVVRSDAGHRQRPDGSTPGMEPITVSAHGQLVVKTVLKGRLPPAHHAAATFTHTVQSKWTGLGTLAYLPTRSARPHV